MKGVIKNGKQARFQSFVCPWCKTSFERETRVVKHNQRNQGKVGPFCGKVCAGKYGASVQIRGHGARRRSRA